MSERLGHVDQPSLRGAVGDTLGVGPGARDRGDVDDDAAIFLGLHDVVHRLAEEHRGQQVEGDDLFVEARRHRGTLGRWGAAGVVDEDVDPTRALDRGVDHGTDLLGISNVSRDEVGFASVGGHWRVGGVAGTDDHLGAMVEKGRRNDPAEAFRAAGDDRRAAGQIEGIAHVHTSVMVTIASANAASFSAAARGSSTGRSLTTKSISKSNASKPA